MKGPVKGTVGVSTKEYWSQGTLIQDEEFGGRGRKGILGHTFLHKKPH